MWVRYPLLKTIALEGKLTFGNPFEDSGVVCAPIDERKHGLDKRDRDLCQSKHGRHVCTPTEATSETLDTTSPPRANKSPLGAPLFCTRVKRIPAQPSTKQGMGETRVGPSLSVFGRYVTSTCDAGSNPQLCLIPIKPHNIIHLDWNSRQKASPKLTDLCHAPTTSTWE
jgi:hypothetical protein